MKRKIEDSSVPIVGIALVFLILFLSFQSNQAFALTDTDNTSSLNPASQAYNHTQTTIDTEEDQESSAGDDTVVMSADNAGDDTVVMSTVSTGTKASKPESTVSYAADDTIEMYTGIYSSRTQGIVLDVLEDIANQGINVPSTHQHEYVQLLNSVREKMQDALTPTFERLMEPTDKGHENEFFEHFIKHVSITLKDRPDIKKIHIPLNVQIAESDEVLNIGEIVIELTQDGPQFSLIKHEGFEDYVKDPKQDPYEAIADKTLKKTTFWRGQALLRGVVTAGITFFLVRSNGDSIPLQSVLAAAFGAGAYSWYLQHNMDYYLTKFLNGKAFWDKEDHTNSTERKWRMRYFMYYLAKDIFFLQSYFLIIKLASMSWMGLDFFKEEVLLEFCWWQLSTLFFVSVPGSFAEGGIGILTGAIEKFRLKLNTLSNFFNGKTGSSNAARIMTQSAITMFIVSALSTVVQQTGMLSDDSTFYFPAMFSMAVAGLVSYVAMGTDAGRNFLEKILKSTFWENFSGATKAVLSAPIKATKFVWKACKAAILGTSRNKDDENNILDNNSNNEFNGA